MSDEERLYFTRRAEEELQLAQRGEHPKAVAAHYQLAQLYYDRAFGEGLGDADRDHQPD
ncbi:MAG TPA: hypothetical protein VGW34_13105 [Allosphingosinicella sp.]|nr:hypothetical protein [Allosphingosinicella sp.]